MIVLLASQSDTERDLLIVALEPANIEKLRIGKPLVLDGSRYGIPIDVSFLYTADPEWVTQQIQRGMPILKALEESVYREPVYRSKDGRDDVKRVL